MTGRYPKIIKALLWRVEIGEDSVRVKAPWGERTAYRADYQIRKRVEHRHGYHFRLIGEGVRRFSLPPTVTEDHIRRTWIGELPDADELALREAVRALRDDERFGSNVLERGHNIFKWRGIAATLAALGAVLIAAFVVSMILKRGVAVTTLGLTLYVPAIVILGGLSQGRLWLIQGDKINASTVQWALTCACFAVGLAFLMGYDFPWRERPGELAVYFGVTGGVTGGLLAWKLAPPTLAGRRALLGLAAGAAFGAGAWTPINALFDQGEPETYTYVVRFMEIGQGKNKTYHAYIVSSREQGWVEVRRGQYEELAPGAPLVILIHPGRLGARWRQILTGAEIPVRVRPPVPTSAGGQSVRSAVYAMADWAARPTAAQMSAVYPARANEAGIAGRARIKCQVKTDGVLAGCEITEEAPRGEGFGAAALALTPYMRMRPRLEDGVPIEGTVMIPVNFTPSS